MSSILFMLRYTGNGMDSEVVRDSVVMGDVSVNNSIIISPDAFQDAQLSKITDALSTFYGSNVHVQSNPDVKELIGNLEIMLQQELQKEHNKREYKYKRQAINAVERDLKDVKHLRFGHIFDTRKQMFGAIHYAGIARFRGTYEIIQLVGYDKENQWAIVWYQEFQAPLNNLNIFAKILDFFRGWKTSKKFGWYKDPLKLSKRYLCSMDIETFKQIYSGHPIVGTVIYGDFRLNLERYIIYVEE